MNNNLHMQLPLDSKVWHTMNPFKYVLNFFSCAQLLQLLFVNRWLQRNWIIHYFSSDHTICLNSGLILNINLKLSGHIENY